MAIATASATSTGSHNTFTICPNWTSGVCACTKDAEGNPQPPHPTYTFGATPPQGWSMPAAPAEWLALGKTQAQWAALDASHQWAFMCLIEAIRLVKHELAAASATTNVTSLVGVTA